MTPTFHHTSFFSCYCHCIKGISKCQVMGLETLMMNQLHRCSVITRFTAEHEMH